MTFDQAFSLLHDQDIDPNLTGCDSNIILDSKDLFRQLWDYDFKLDSKGYTNRGDMRSPLNAWYWYEIESETSISQDEKWILENFYHKFVLLYKLKTLVDPNEKV